MAAKALHSSNRSVLMRMTGSDEAGSQSKNDAHGLLHLVTSCGLLKHDHNEMASHVLWQQRRLEVTPRLHHVGVVDETRRTYRHHGRQRDAPRRIVTFHHATLRVATHRYATLEPLGEARRLARVWRGRFPSIACGSETPTAASRRLKPRRSDNEGAS